MTNFEILTWATAAIALVGVILNISKSRWGFFCWSITNGVWAIVDWQSGIHAQALLFFVYWILALVGWVSWSKNPPKKSREETADAGD